MKLRLCFLPLGGLAAALASGLRAADTIAFWAFDEPAGMYPSSVLSDQGPNDYPLVLGSGGSVVPGRFGRALSTASQPPVEYPAGSVLFGLTRLPAPAGRTMAPLTWHNATFAALMTAGENHLRKEFAHPNATATALNLGDFDWTVEFWYRGAPRESAATDAVVFEVGEGPRGENDHITALRLDEERSGFVFVNQPSGTRVAIASDAAALTQSARWSHLAFVYSSASHELAHYVDGKPVGRPVALTLKPLPRGEEAYFTVGRDARWEHPLPGAIDELRFSRGTVYTGGFTPPASLVPHPDAGAPARRPEIREPLRFAGQAAAPVALGSSKHLLIDDALFPEHANVSFVPTPPDKVELLFEITSTMRKHLVVLEDEQGVIRLYSPVGRGDRLAVRTSRDGVHFEIPKLSGLDPANPNIVTTGAAGTPAVFIDPLAPPVERWKLVSGDEGRGIFLHTSPDGYDWTRLPTAVVSAASASQTNMFYDDQRGSYLAYLRTDIARNAFGKTERTFVLAEVDSVRPPWPFHPLTQADYNRAAATMKLGETRPWYLDNGPLTPGGVGIEWPTVFRPTPGLDPVASDIYVPKAIKYPWAPDTYLAFPCIYFHYEGTAPRARDALSLESRGRGSGPIETQLMTSRDGVNWKRHPRPVWLGVGLTDGFDVHQTYMAQGMVRRQDEIWMYSYSTEEYHSTYRQKPERRGVFRTVQRVDRFVAAEAPYDREATMLSRPLVFAGRKLVLNVDTAASGWLQIGFVGADGKPLPGRGVDDCVYVSGNALRYPVEWLERGTDVSELAGQSVRLAVRMRGARLFALQFTD